MKPRRRLSDVLSSFQPDPNILSTLLNRIDSKPLLQSPTTPPVSSVPPPHKSATPNVLRKSPNEQRMATGEHSDGQTRRRLRKSRPQQDTDGAQHIVPVTRPPRSQIIDTPPLKDTNKQLPQLPRKRTEPKPKIAEVEMSAEAKSSQEPHIKATQKDEDTTAPAAVEQSAPAPRSTVRELLMLDIINKRFREDSFTDRPEVAQFLHSCSQDTLTSYSMDIRLNERQTELFPSTIDTDYLSILTCDICHVPKIIVEEGAQGLQHISEFQPMSQPTLCCANNICIKCYLAGIKASLNDWWARLDQPDGIPCPALDCNSIIFAGSSPENLLRYVGDGEIKESMAIWQSYKLVTSLRSILHTLNLDDEAIRTARQLHEHLVRKGKMDSPLDSKFNISTACRTDSVEMIQLNDRTTCIPLFTQFLRRQRPESPTECAFCTEPILDIAIGSVEDWADLGSSFQGDWMWSILLLPQKLRLPFWRDDGSVEYCRHDIDFCTDCLQRHLESQLEQHGRKGCDRLTCPAQDCRRLLRDDEIQLYAKAETFERYDNYKFLNVISQDPAFRWCLGQGCSNGELHDNAGNPWIRCSECGFEMCYYHGEPWHEGLTCEQHNNFKKHGDADYQRTMEWIHSNTKPCPGCGENIQKGAACFHMRCSQCNYEFCWMCLANWRQISPTAGQHNVNSHGQGCPFRTAGVTPSQIFGENFEEAMRRRAV